MKKDTKSLIKLFNYYKKYKGLCFLVFLLSFSYAAVSLLVPICEGNLLSVFENFNPTKIFEIAILLCIIKIIIEILTNIWSRVVLKLNGKINFDLKKDMLESLMSFEMKNFDNVNSGIFISRLNKDTFELSELFDYVTDDLSGILLNVSFIVYILLINTYLGLFLILNIILNYILSSKKLYYYKKTRKIYKENDEALVGSYTDLVRGIREVKDLNLKSVFLEEIDRQQKDTIYSQIKTIDTRRTWNRWIKAFQHLVDLIFIIISVFFIKNNSLTISTFLIVFLYKNKILTLIDYITEIREVLADGKISAVRVFDIINYNKFSKEQFGEQEFDQFEGKIQFKNVCFSYNGNELFKHLNLKIEPNKMIAIVGKSGEGKSTILKLINKSYDINSGAIYIDGVNLNELKESSIKNNISIVSQSPYIFNLSIKENIKLANPNATDEEIIEVCKQAQIHQDIMRMEKQYDTLVGENGVILSGGQKQRIAIARALMKQSKIILFDEATSALDNKNQEKIKKVIKNLSKDHTIIIVAHRLSTIVNADTIYFLDDHKIIDQGTHNELMEHCLLYKNLYEVEQ